MAFPQNEVEAIGWDWIAAVSVQNKSWLLRQFLPVGRSEFDINRGVRQDSRQEMLRQFSEEGTPSEAIEHITVGNEEDCVIETKDAHHGHLKLCIKSLSEDKMGSELRIKQAGKKQYLCGKVVLEDNAENEKNLTYALHSPHFPKSAMEWDTRQRPAEWPSAGLREKVKKVGCNLIPRHHIQSKDPALEWQFNFCEAEKQLVESLNDTQLECYTLLKMLYEREFKRPQFLTTAHLKTVLFRTCERLPQKQWRDEKLGDCLMLLLDELLHYLIQNEMPHYFVAKNNMIDHVHEDFIWEMQLKVCDVRQNPVKFLFSLRCLEIPDFTDIPIQPYKRKKSNIQSQANAGTGQNEKQNSFRTTHEESMGEDAVEEDTLDKSETQNTAEKVSGLIMEHKFDESIETFMEFYGRGLFQTNDGKDHSPVKLLQYLGQHLPEKEMTKFGECIVKRFPDDKELGSLLSNMGCYYFAESGRETDEVRKSELIVKAEEAFLSASERPHFNSANHMDYANFLFQTKRFHKAQPLLQRIVEDQQNEPSQANSYGEYEKVNLDENLQREIEYRKKEIIIPSVVHAYYLLVRCLLQSDDCWSDCRKICEQFENACNKVDDSEKPLSFSMLGYTYIELKSHENASKAFYTAHQLQPEYALAKENLQFCNAILETMKESLQTGFQEDSSLAGGPPTGSPSEETCESRDESSDVKCHDLMDTLKICLAQNDSDAAVAELTQYWVQRPDTYSDPSLKNDFFVALMMTLTLEQLTNLESMIKEFPGKENMGGVLASIAQVYFIKAAKESEQGRKKWLMVKAEEAFSWAEEKLGFTAADRVNFANFLYCEKRFPEACRHLTQITEEESQDPKDVNLYTALHVDIVDEKIQQEIEANEGQIIIIPSVVLSHYLLLKCHLETEPELHSRVEDLEQMLHKYEQCCQRVKISDRPVAYAIFGYSLFELQMFKRAAAHFKSAFELDQGYLLAEENKELCDGMELSMAADS